MSLCVREDFVAVVFSPRPFPPHVMNSPWHSCLLGTGGCEHPGTRELLAAQRCEKYRDSNQLWRACGQPLGGYVRDRFLQSYHGAGVVSLGRGLREGVLEGLFWSIVLRPVYRTPGD